MEHDGVIAWPETENLHDAGDRPDAVEIFETRLVDLGVALADDTDDRALMSYEVLDETNAPRTADVDWHDARRKDHAISERQDRKQLGVRARTRVAHHPWL
jgi:hypothetical protein